MVSAYFYPNFTAREVFDAKKEQTQDFRYRQARRVFRRRWQTRTA
jgi:hypothetical protein